MLLVVLGRNSEIYGRKEWENKRLNQSDKNLQKQKRGRQKIKKNSAHRGQEHFSGKNIAEKPEWKRSHFGHFPD